MTTNQLILTFVAFMALHYISESVYLIISIPTHPWNKIPMITPYILYLCNIAFDLSPTRTNLNLSAPSSLTLAFNVLTIEECIAPQRPLSDVRARTSSRLSSSLSLGFRLSVRAVKICIRLKISTNTWLALHVSLHYR